ncbi:MAG: MFS transporter [Hydrococcus sp. C42_A2020_068]|nr:MFS transporter [Hydrococcus sp. C42_A2020_068]
MLKLPGDVAIVKTRKLSVSETLTPPNSTDRLDDAIAIAESAFIAPSAKPAKQQIRSSLKASTYDSIFSTIFSCATGDVLLSNFLLNLGATSVEIGYLAAIPMLANFLQPVGAYLADRTISRRWYNFRVFSPARMLWMILVLGIIGFGAHLFEAHQLIQWTLLISLFTHTCSAMGSASWVSWMAVLVPRRLRGRYFGLRNSMANLTNLFCVPLLGMIMSYWGGGTIQAYSLVLTLAVLAGIVSLSFQLLMADVNPQAASKAIAPESDSSVLQPPAFVSLLRDTNFLKYLFYYGVWMFAINLSLPFFNVYLLKNLGLDIGCVTIYSSLNAGANVLMLLIWGKLADHIGNRQVLLSVGILVAAIPLLWLGVNTDRLSVWLWLPLLYVLWGSAWSAIDLCSNNLQMAIAPIGKSSSSYFATAAAISGLGGALGTTIGGFLSQYASFGGIDGLFILSAVLRLVALLPLIFVREPGRQSPSLLLS